MPIAGTNVGTTYLNVTANTTPYKKSLQGLGSYAGKIGKVIGTAFAVKSLAKFSLSCVELASDLSEVNNVTNKAFAGMGKQVDEWAQKAVNSYGLSETMAKSYLGTFGAMANSFGFTRKEAFEMSSALAGLAGDIASFYNTSQEEAFTKLKSVFTGETESLKQLGVVMTQTALNEYALANGFGKTVQQMTEAEKVSLRYAFVLNQLKFANGDFAQTLGSSWANQIRVLKLNFESLKATIGKSLMAVLMPVIKVINAILTGLTVLARKFNTVFSKLTGLQLDDSTAQVSVNLDDAGGSAGGLADSLDDAGGSAGGATQAVKNLKRELMGFDKITKLSEVTDAGGSGGGGGAGGVGGGGATVDTTPATKTAQALGKIKLPENLLKAFDHLKSSLADIAKIGKDALLYVWEKVLKPLGKWTLNRLAPPLVEALASAFDLLKEVLLFFKPVAQFIFEKILAPLAKLLGEALIKYLEWTAIKFQLMALALRQLRVKLGELFDKYVKPFIQRIAPSVKKGLENIGSAVKTAILGKMVQAIGKVKAFADAVKNIPNKVAEIKAEVKTKWEEIKGTWNRLISNIKDKTASMKARVATTWSAIKQKWFNITSNIKDKTADMRARIATTWGNVRNRWHNITDHIKSKTAYMYASIGSTWSSLKWTWESLMSNFRDKYVSVYLSIVGSIQDLKRWFNDNVIYPLNVKIHSIPLFKSISIPYLAQGGYVGRNTPRLAVIGDNTKEGEIVSPESKLQAMADSAVAGGNKEVLSMLSEILQAIRNVDTDTYIDGKKITDVIVKQINKNTRATGKLAIEV